ncbi:hypothetical protein C8R44DRAFT_900176 [Mycena epipterygia]|nr:hypothetical protein C8R44DRAFT_900176 [Mycena epipterygia]
MASATQLRTHIADLSSAIDLQKQVLRDLEQKRSDTRRELNDILDPMARLPLEISSDIFMHCLTTSEPDPSAAPMVFLSVCHLWSHVALSTPSLWAVIHAKLPRDDSESELDKLLAIWLARARTLPLSISLRGSLDSNPGLCALVNRHAHQVQNLELYLVTGSGLKEITESFPSLKTLTIGRKGDVNEFYSHSLNDCIGMLRAAPALIECTFDEIHYGETFNPGVAVFIHPNLKHLHLDGDSAILLEYLTLPGLESLSIPDFEISYDGFLAFLIRSSPPLQSLSMMLSPAESADGVIQRVLRILPQLTDLNLSGNFSDASILLEALAGSPQESFPHLCHLTVRRFTIDHHQYEELVSMLSARRASHPSPMQSFTFIFNGGRYRPAAHIIAAFQQLVADGMEIHIGPLHTNWIQGRNIRYHLLLPSNHYLQALH